MTEAPRSTILIVDDEPVNLQTLGGVLRDEFRTLIARDGESALQIAAAESPDLILLDIMMPGLDGYEVCRRLKQDEKTQGISVIFVTSLSDSLDEAKGLALGAVDYLHKPVSPEIVLARVRSRIALRSARQQLLKQNQELQLAMKVREDMETVMRHDLKSPLGAVLGFIDLVISRDMVNEKGRGMLLKARAGAYRILGLVNSSLDLVKMEMGNYQLDAVPVSLHKIMGVVIEDKTSIADQKSIKLDSAALADFPVYCDELLTHSMLTNLLRNAIDAAPDNSRIIIKSALEGDFVSLEISNQGEVPLEIRDRFFEKYVTSGKKEGTGLGTYSSRLMARTQNGDVLLDASREGMTTLTVKLPVAPASESADDPGES